MQVLKKKLLPNKQNTKAKKGLGVSAFSSTLALGTINWTEDVRLATCAAEVKSLVKSIELKRSGIRLPKKGGSRKGRSKSAKGGVGAPPRLKNIMRQFKQLKIVQENERSKPKSPASCKSKSTKKQGSKKHFFTTLRTNPHSEINLTIKLERTLINKLNDAEESKDSDDIIPLVSCSQVFQDQQSCRLLTENEEEINIVQLRQFCSSISLLRKSSMKPFRADPNIFRENIYESMAIRIQRAWRRYQTKRLVQRYAYMYRNQYASYTSELFWQPQERQENVLRSEQPVGSGSDGLRSDQIMIPSQEFYPEGMQREKVTQISNLQSQGIGGLQEESYEQVVKRIKMEELQKWNEIISIISINKSNNPVEMQKLLAKLTKQSEINKKDLEQKANNVFSFALRRKYHEEDDHIKQKKEDKGLSELNAPRDAKHSQDEVESQESQEKSEKSKGVEQYDSRKYIQYLDGDVFPCEPSSEGASQGGRIGVIPRTTISKQKQQKLLQELKSVNFPIKLGESALYRSESLKEIHVSSSARGGKIKQSLKKSTSEKMLRRTLNRISPRLSDHDEQEMNLDLLTKQFLEGGDPMTQDLDMLYSQERLRSKLAELNQIKREDSQDQLFIHEEMQDGSGQLQRTRGSGVDWMRFQDQARGRGRVQDVDQAIDSDSEEQIQEKDTNERGESVAVMVFSTLLLEVLRQIARYDDTILRAFKDYSIAARPKVKRIEPTVRKKRGFPTNKAEIEQFLDGLLHFLQKEQPEVFRNLQVATGPSAVQMLRYMHQSGEQSLNLGEEEQDESNVMVVPNRVFESFWQLKEKSIVLEVNEGAETASQAFRQNYEYLKGFNKIFYRSLFDTFNECLDCQRNFGQFGRPFPWKKSATFHHIKTASAIEVRLFPLRHTCKMLERECLS